MFACVLKQHEGHRVLDSHALAWILFDMILELKKFVAMRQREGSGAWQSGKKAMT